jgi:predicted secreted Zn-dependent protease
VIASESLYTVAGSSATELAAALVAHGPRMQDTPLFALTEAQIRWRVTPRRTRPRGDACKPHQPRVELHIRVTLPRWIPPASSDEPLRAHWDRFLAALNVHEADHQDLGRRAANDMLDALRALPPAPCDVIASTVDKAAHTILGRFHDRTEAYDRDTFHGATQGVVWPPMPNAPNAQPDQQLLQRSARR